MQTTIDHNKYLDPVELIELEASLELHKGTIESTLLSILLFTGARTCEALSLTERSLGVDSEGLPVLSIPGAKGSKGRVLPIRKDLASAIKTIINQNLKDPKGKRRLFPFTDRTVRRIWDRYKPTWKPVHSLRHTFAIKLLSKTRDIHKVKTCLGHKSINSTMVYSDLLYTSKELRSDIL